MALYAVLDRNQARWDVCTSQQAATASKKALNARQPQFKPFTVEPIKEEKS